MSEDADILKLKIELANAQAAAANAQEAAANAQSKEDAPRYALWTAIASSIIAPMVLAAIQLILHWYEIDDRKKATEKVEATTVAAAAEVKEVATEKAKEIKTDLDATKKATTSALSTIAATTLDTNATTAVWRAEHTGEKEDMEKAEAALAKAAEKLEKMP